MNDIYVLDRDLRKIGIVDSCKSVIWANRYNQIGDCELYVPATEQNLDLLRQNYFLLKYGNPMICRIKKIELDTSAEDGNYLVVTGIDAKEYLDQRIIWNTENADGAVEAFVRTLVNSGLGADAIPERQITDSDGNVIFGLGAEAGFTEAVTEQVSYKNLGEKVRDYCLRYQWGYRVIFDSGILKFELYKGQDRTTTVVFSEDYENLSTTKYVEDETKMGNVALIAGEGEGAARFKTSIGTTEGSDRYEVYVDAKDISKTITYEELRKAYPGGTIISTGTGYVYQKSTLNIQILNEVQLEELEEEYPSGSVVVIDGNQYYQVQNVAIASVPSAAPEDGDEVVLKDVVYSVYMLTRGYEKLAEYGFLVSFEGSVEPNTTFVYNRDYFLGDLVTIRNDFGITVQARITEIIEVDDDNGSSVDPKFEYITGG